MRRTSASRPSPLLRSKAPRAAASGALVAVDPERAGWDRVHFSVRRLEKGQTWTGRTGGNEVCLVLLGGHVAATWATGGARRDRGTARLGPRRDVFTDYPHALYLPPGTRVAVEARRTSEFALCGSPTETAFPAREIRPEDCGLEVRGGGNATRQIVDILPPSADADRLLVCEVFTPSGNWSSYPPHKHDRHAPPVEVDLEETYYYRFKDADGYGIQRLYTADGGHDTVVKVVHGDLVLVHDGYHPFVAAYGYDAYYLNTLAGSQRSMAASDDPRYAHLRQAWPAPDPRVPMVERPNGAVRRR